MVLLRSLSRHGSVAWKELQAAGLKASIGGKSKYPGLAWVHGLGGSCAADDARGLSKLLSPSLVKHQVLRLDVRGHGRSAVDHSSAIRSSQYEWSSLAEDLRCAVQDAKLRTPIVLGGEASGVGVVLHAAACSAEGQNAPAALVLMRPPVIWNARMVWRTRYEMAARYAEQEGMASKDLEAEAKRRLFAAGFGGSEAKDIVLKEWRSMNAEVYAAALRGLAASEIPDDESLRQLNVRTLILGLAGDEEHPLQSAEDLAVMIPNSELVVAKDVGDALRLWPSHLRNFLADAS